MWTFQQSTGALIGASGEVLAHGYSGHGSGVDNPALENVPDVGPLPEGTYSLGAPVNDPATPSSACAELAHLGPFAIPLIPHAGNEMFGRGGFFIHGDDVNHAGERTASEGCIVLDPTSRHAIWASPDHILRVVSGE